MIIVKISENLLNILKKLSKHWKVFFNVKIYLEIIRQCKENSICIDFRNQWVERTIIQKNDKILFFLQNMQFFFNWLWICYIFLFYWITVSLFFLNLIILLFICIFLSYSAWNDEIFVNVCVLLLYVNCAVNNNFIQLFCW